MEEFLDGIALSDSIDITTGGTSLVTGLAFGDNQFDFLLPFDYARDSLALAVNQAVPDLTGLQTYSESSGSFSYTVTERLIVPFINARVATTEDISLSGIQSIDGVSLSAGDRVLVKTQNLRTENGLYEVASGSWSRVAPLVLADGVKMWVSEGSINLRTGWVLSVLGVADYVFDLVDYKLSFVEANPVNANESYLGRVLASGTHFNSLPLGWETVRFLSSVSVSQSMLGSTFNVKITDSDFAWPSNTLRYRILAATADSGLDLFGNQSRSIVRKSGIENLSSSRAFWMSSPNPSKFAVESLYFDHLTDITIDSIEVDPLTPGIIMSVYYSSDGDSAVSTEDWDNKLWDRVPRTYRLTHKNRFALPQPISARFVKLEFSSLQARPYNPGGFNKEIEYKKHPKWVLDYFLIDMEQKRLDDLVPTSVDVVHDAYALAFSYYQDEQRTLMPSELGKVQNFQSFLAKNDLENLVDLSTAARIDYSFSPFVDTPPTKNSILAQALLGIYSAKNGVNILSPDIVESIGEASMAVMTEVSTLNREKLMSELSYPEMFFFVKCRHKYRVVKTTFRDQRAYFAGINGVRFIRDTYTNDSSPSVYNEAFNDFVNMEINDFA